ncbi:hypothetical protein [Metabacillus bambusae]|uniref:Polymerase nucleotidyl transferase domain-containing protein n=1 Tax=Metabacillus bambusae TaxID=2795218 RepID=A0ABS3N7Y6_9BACI|nr:hypothetical protein [Metabacillus bambusae]MBO1514165.1 hypothetical protein [Metabacillus bambusae]
MDKSWKGVLSKVCEIYFQSNTKIDWILVGSVLQGCKMEPGDIDIYVKHKEGVSQFAELLNEFSLPTKSENRHVNDWLSSKEEPVFNQTFPSGFTWTKGRWKINGFNVEVVHISDSAGIPDSITGDGIWEGGQYIWSNFKNVRIGEYTIPTVPLEIQLELNLRRQRQDRIKSILNTIMHNGYDEKLIKKALSSHNLSYFYSEVGLPS